MPSTCPSNPFYAKISMIHITEKNEVISLSNLAGSCMHLFFILLLHRKPPYKDQHCHTCWLNFILLPWPPLLFLHSYIHPQTFLLKWIILTYNFALFA